MQQKVILNNLAHYKLIILKNDYHKNLYNMEVIILIIPKITLVNYFEYKWMCSWSFIKGEMKLRHGKFCSLLQPHIEVSGFGFIV
jgi:hypothetical protein